MKSKSSFSQFVLLSTGLHMGLILVVLGKINFFPREDVLLTNSIKVTMVALPDKEPPKKPISKANSPKKKKKVSLNKKKSKKKKIKSKNKNEQKNAFEKLKQKSAFESLKKKATPPKEFKGNIINEGHSLEGLSQARFHEYYQLFKDHLYNNWTVPKWLEGQDYKAEAVVKIDRQGSLVVKSLTKSSGNTVFDESILTAIDKSVPFPSPPDSIKSVISRQTFKLGFPRNE